MLQGLQEDNAVSNSIAHSIIILRAKYAINLTLNRKDNKDLEVRGDILGPKSSDNPSHLATEGMRSSLPIIWNKVRQMKKEYRRNSNFVISIHSSFWQSRTGCNIDEWIQFYASRNPIPERADLNLQLSHFAKTDGNIGENLQPPTQSRARLEIIW